MALRPSDLSISQVGRKAVYITLYNEGGLYLAPVGGNGVYKYNHYGYSGPDFITIKVGVLKYAFVHFLVILSR